MTSSTPRPGPPVEGRTQEAARSHSKRSRRIARAGKLGLFGLAVIASIFGVVIWGVQGANKPHEVRGEAVVVALWLILAALTVWIVADLLRAWRSPPGQPLTLPQKLWLIPALVFLLPILALLFDLPLHRFK